MIKVCLIGLGKTGLVVAKNFLESNDLKLVMAVCSTGSKKEGMDLGKLLNTRDTGIEVMGADKLSEGIRNFMPDVVVDFSSPEGCVKNLEIIAKNKINAVIATTGFNEFQEQKIKNIVKEQKIGVVMAPNITTGVNVMRYMCEIIASLLDDYDVEISESHHRNKKDSPSGTALKIADSIYKGRNIRTKRLIFDRSCVKERLNNEIGISSIRAGGIVGIHKVIFASEHDMIEISHQSFSRDIFASGAEKAVKYILGRKGMYDMDDVLDLKSYTLNQGAYGDSNLAR